MVATIKFSQFNSANLNDDTNQVVGVGGGDNFQSSKVITWTTSTRPSMPFNGLLGYNSDLQKYEFYDTSINEWVQMALDTNGNVDPSTANNLAWYATTGNTLTGLATANNAILATSNTGVPSLSQALPAAVQVGVDSLNEGTGATSSTFWRGDGTWATVSGGSGTVTSITAGTGLDSTPNPITSSGTMTLAEISALSLLANNTGSSAIPSAYALSNFLLSGNNLSDLNNVSDALINLGLGTPTGTGDVVLNDSPLLITPMIQTALWDTNGTPILGLTTVAAAVNFIQLSNSATGTNPVMSLGGSDPTIAFNFESKGGVFNYLDSTLTNGAQISLYDSTQSFYVGFIAPALTGSQIWTLPAADGTSGYVLSTNGSGVLSWIAGGGGGSSPWTVGSGANSAYGGLALDSAADYSLVWGQSSYTTAGDINTIILGSGSYTSGSSPNSVLLGGTSRANGSNIISIGNGLSSQNSYAINIGLNSTVTGQYGIAIGAGISVTGVQGVGILYGSNLADYGVGIGRGFNILTGHTGAFNFCDSLQQTNASKGANSFSAYFAGGYWLYTGGTLLSLVTNTTDGATSLLGTTLAANPSAGYVGEVITSAVTAQAITSNTDTNVTSITLTAGDWDVYGNVLAVPATTTTSTLIACGLSTTSATLPANQYAAIPGVSVQLNIGTPAPSIRVNVSTSTPVYLVGHVTYAVSTLTINGTLWARRRR